MKNTRRIAIAVPGLMIAASVAMAPALAAPSTTPGTAFSSHATPAKNVKSGEVVTVTGTKAETGTQFDCLFVVTHGKAYGADIASARLVKSTTSGKITCKQTFRPFTVSVSGKARHCPLTAADAKAGFACGIALGDAPTMGQTSQSMATFKAHGSK
jgi:hypothetical protein